MTEHDARFRILAADKLAQEGLDYISSQPDAELVSKPGLSEEELAEAVSDFDGMIVRSGADVTAKVLESPGHLKAVARAGVGVDNIDLAAATERGILVMNTAAANMITTAEHAFALLMAAARHLGPAYRTMAEGGWDRSKFVGSQLSGKTLGVVGFGRIGQTVAERALAFNMKVVGYDPFYAEATALDGRVRMHQDFVKMLPDVDALTFHVPLNDETHGMLNDETFEQCREGVIVVNASRGAVVNEQALLNALDSGRAAAGALDVFEQEPPPEDSPLRGHPKLLTTPHLGASTREAQQAVSIDAARALLGYLRGEGIEGAVNVPGLKMDLDPTQSQFVDLSHRMGRILSPMVGRSLKQVTVEVTGDWLSGISGTLERYALMGLLQDHLDPPVNIVNVRHLAEERGIKLRVVNLEQERSDAPQLALRTQSSEGGRHIVGRVYSDLRPRVTEIDGYHMDMIPGGHLVLLFNEDRPGMVGLVGRQFGEADVNVADMNISRHDKTALTVLKVDSEPPRKLLDALRGADGVLQVYTVRLPEEAEAGQSTS